MRVLVKEKIADSGVDLLREEFDVELGLDWADEELARADRRLRRDPHPLGHQDDRRTLIARAERLQVIGRAGTGVDNVDVAGGDQARDRRRQRAGVELGRRRRAHARADARALPQHPAGARLAHRGRVGALASSAASSSTGRPSASSASAASASSSPSARRRSTCTSSPSTRSWRPSASASSASRARETTRRALRAGRLHHHPPAEDARDDRLDRRRGVRARCATACGSSTAPAASCRLEALQDALDSGKVAGAALDVFPSEPFTEHPLFGRDERGRDAAPGRLDGRGPGPRRHRHRRAGGRRAHRRRRHQRGQHRRGPAGGHGGAGAVPPAVREARAPRAGPRRAARSSGSRPSSAAASPSYDTRLLGIAVLVGILSRPHRGAGQPRQRAGDGRGARDRAHRGQGRGLARTSPSWSACGRPATSVVEVAGTGVGPQQRPHLVGRLGPELLPAARRPPRALPLRRPARA